MNTHAAQHRSLRGGPQRFKGIVVSARSKDTIVVRVSRYVQHPRYRKYVVRSKKVHAHDPGNTAAEGAVVVVEASRPYSRLKRFRLVEIVRQPSANEAARAPSHGAAS